MSFPVRQSILLFKIIQQGRVRIANLLQTISIFFCAWKVSKLEKLAANSTGLIAHIYTISLIFKNPTSLKGEGLSWSRSNRFKKQNMIHGVGGLINLIWDKKKMMRPDQRSFTSFRIYKEENLFRNYKVNCQRNEKLG